MTPKEFAMKYTAAVINFVTGILPLKNQIIFESNPDFEDNSFYLYKRMVELGYNKKYKMIWVLNGERNDYDLPENVSVIRRAHGSIVEKLKENWEIGRSKFIIDCNIFVYKRSSRQIRIFLEHGLTFKNVPWYAFEVGEIDMLPVPSEYWIDKMAEEHNLSTDKVKVLGLPRNDILIPESHEIKNIIWMPTWISKNFDEDDKDGSYDELISKMPFGLPAIDKKEDFEKINELFRKHNAILYIRLHPVQDTSVIPISEMSNIVLCNNDFLNQNHTTLYKFLCKTDALVSDYSSIYFDYLKLNKPIALVTKHFNEYKNCRDSLIISYDEYKERYPAFFAESFEELLAFFENVLCGNDPDAEKRLAVKEKYMPDCIIPASDRVIEYMKENYNF